MANSPSTDWPAIYRILGDSTRREIIHYLLERGSQTTLEELTAAVADEDDDEDRREAIRVRLFHVTLPMMAEAALLEWDSETGHVELTNTTYQVPLGALSPPDVPVLSQGHGQRADD